MLVADVVSYTRLMEAAELETYARFRTLRVKVIDPTIISYRGEIVKNTGDGFVAVFESPTDAICCAAELQQLLAAQEAQNPPERRISFRFGVHWEPVILDLNDVYGGGVNVAARLQTFAPAGGIVFSSALLGEVGDLKGFKFDDLGEIGSKSLAAGSRLFIEAVGSRSRHRFECRQEAH